MPHFFTSPPPKFTHKDLRKQSEEEPDAGKADPLTALP
jgi:hypothetical protein